MNIQPPATVVALAGTQRAVSGDAQTTAAHTAGNQQRAEMPAGRSDGTPRLEAGDGASDGEADGRRDWQQQHREPDDQQPPSKPLTTPRRPSPDGIGGQVDFDA